jgi:hypothetical protein
MISTLRKIAIIEITSIILYIVYRENVESMTNSYKENTIFAFCALFHFIASFLFFLTSNLINSINKVVQLSTLVLFFAFLCDTYNLTVTFSNQRTGGCAFLIISYVCYDVILLLYLTYINFYLLLSSNTLKSSNKKSLSNNICQEDDDNHLLVVKCIIVWTATFEGTILFYYTLSSASIIMKDESGWIFFGNFITLITAMINIYISEKNNYKIKSDIWILSFSAPLFFLELVQLLSNWNDDLAIFIGMRLMLCGCSLSYSIAIIYKLQKNLKFSSVIPRISIFNLINFGLIKLTVTEVALLGGYFIFAITVSSRIIWTSLVHLLSVFISASICYIIPEQEEEESLTYFNKELAVIIKNMCYALLIFTFLLFIHDLIIIQISENYELAFFVFFLILDLLYIIISSTIIYNKQKIYDNEYIFKLKLTNTEFQKNVDFIFMDYQNENDYYNVVKRGIDIILNIIEIIFVKAVIFETVFFYTLLLIIFFQLNILNLNIPWYQWFYLVHFFSIIAGLATTFRVFDIKLSLILLNITAVISLLSDIFLFAFLLNNIEISLIPLQIILLCIDFVYIFGYLFIISSTKDVGFTCISLFCHSKK